MNYKVIILLICAFWAPYLPAPGHGPGESTTLVTSVVRLPPLGMDPVPVQSLLQQLNPHLEDPMAALERDYEALLLSELGWLLRDIGEAQVASALAEGSSGDILVHRFFDQFVQLKYGLKLHRAHDIIHQNTKVLPAEAADAGVDLRCLCNVDLASWLAPPASGKLFNPLSAEAQSSLFIALPGGSAGTAGAVFEPDVAVLSGLSASVDQQNFSERLAAEIASLPEVLTPTMRERITFQAFVDLATSWSQYQVIIHKLIAQLPHADQDAADEQAQKDAEQLASHEVADRDSPEWRLRYLNHLEKEEFRHSAAIVRNDPDFIRRLLDTYAQAFGHELNRTKLRWLGGPNNIDSSTLFYREFFRAAYRAAHASGPEVMAAVKHTADEILENESVVVPIGGEIAELIWLKPGYRLGWRRGTLASHLLQMRLLRRAASWTDKNLTAYRRLQDKVTIFEVTGKTLNLFVRPFFRQRILMRLQKPITWYLRVYKAEDPDPDRRASCPRSFVP